MISIENSKKQLTLEELEKTESRLGFKFPIDYKDFLLKHNGGTPKPNTFIFIEKSIQSNSLVDFFHAIYDAGSDGNLELDYNYFRSSSRIPPNIVPIAGDPFGNFICLSVAGNDKGKMYFWDHESEPQNSSYENLSLIADSFTKFLSILK